MAELSSETIGISYELASDAVVDLTEQATQVEGLLSNLSVVEGSLGSDIWETSDGQFFRENFPDFKEKMNIVEEDITGIKNWVEMAIQYFQSTENQNQGEIAAAMSGLG